jgi:hypothetical protein
MCLRISSAALALAVAGCGAGSPLPQGETVDCAIGNTADFAPVCILERAGDSVVVHHPDGSFRRFTLDPARGGLSPRDGAEALVPAGDSFAVGADRYRIPASLIAPPVP